jgi:hypothetical protein
VRIFDELKKISGQEQTRVRRRVSNRHIGGETINKAIYAQVREQPPEAEDPAASGGGRGIRRR